MRAYALSDAGYELATAQLSIVEYTPSPSLRLLPACAAPKPSLLKVQTTT